MRRPALSPWVETFVEWFIAGIAGALAEEAVRLGSKAIRKRLKKKKEPPNEP